jgi:hypothetical protein
LAGSANNDAPREDHGNVILFPGVPRDGVEPLDGVDPAPPGSDGASNGSRRAAFEAGDFWDNGDTQEFVGVAGSSSSAESEVVPGATSTLEPEVGPSPPSPTEQNPTRPLEFERRVGYGRRPRRAALLAAVVVVAASAAVAVVLVSRPSSIRRVGSYAAVHPNETPTTSNRSARTASTRSRLTRAHRPVRRSPSVRRHRTAPPAIVHARYTPPAAPQYTESTPYTAGTSDQPRAVAASSDTSSSSASPPAQSAGPTGAGALTGAGGTPSG